MKRAEEEEREEVTSPFTFVNVEDTHRDGEETGEEIPPRENAPPVIGMPKIEGVFTNYPATMSITAATGGSQSSGSSDIKMRDDSSETDDFSSLPSLPLMPARRQTSVSMLVGRYENLQAATPPPSSRQGSEQPEHRLGDRREEM